jgi:hypothetical protein
MTDGFAATPGNNKDKSEESSREKLSLTAGLCTLVSVSETGNLEAGVVSAGTKRFVAPRLESYRDVSGMGLVVCAVDPL